jgi:hypothetical protein
MVKALVLIRRTKASSLRRDPFRPRCAPLRVAAARFGALDFLTQPKRPYTQIHTRDCRFKSDPLLRLRRISAMRSTPPAATHTQR